MRPYGRRLRVQGSFPRAAAFLAVTAAAGLMLPASTLRADNGLRPASFDRPVPLVIDFHVAQARTPEGPRPLVDRAFVEATVARASAIWSSANLRFRLGKVNLLPEGKHLHMWNRWMRSALNRILPDRSDGAIDVFVVRTLVDLGRASSSLPGVHWFSNYGPRPRYYVILGSRSVGEETLAHELGHHFGLGHAHSRVNIMRPGADRRDARLTRWQVRRAQERVAYFLEKGMLRRDDAPARAPVPAPAPAVAMKEVAAGAGLAAPAGSHGPASSLGSSPRAAPAAAPPAVLLFSSPR